MQFESSFWSALRDYYIYHGQERAVLGKKAEKYPDVIVNNCGKSSRQVQLPVSKANSAMRRKQEGNFTILNFSKFFTQRS